MKDALIGIAWLIGILAVCAFLSVVLTPPVAFVILLVIAAFAFGS